jgi:hypothetical protein
MDLACRNFACSLPFAGNQLRNMVTLSEVPTRNPNPSAFDPAAFVATSKATGHRVCVWNAGWMVYDHDEEAREADVDLMLDEWELSCATRTVARS